MSARPSPILRKDILMSEHPRGIPPKSISPLLRGAIIGYIVLTGSVCYVAILEGSRWAPPFVFAGARTMLGGLALLLTAGIVRQPLLPARSLWRWVPVVAVTATGITFGAMFLSPQFAGAGLPAILGNAQPLFIVIIAWLFLQERLSLARGLSLAVSCFGLVLVILPAVSGGGIHSLDRGHPRPTHFTGGRRRNRPGSMVAAGPLAFCPHGMATDPGRRATPHDLSSPR